MSELLLTQQMAHLLGTSDIGAVGIGVDIENVSRWRDPALKLEALLTSRELEHGAGTDLPARHWAGTWCAKEAVFKALDRWVTLGVAPRSSLRDIEILRTPSGAPVVHLRHSWPGEVVVSISHTNAVTAGDECAIAVAVSRHVPQT